MTATDRAGIALVAGSYLLGSVPFGLLLARAFAGVDVRSTGSGNIGATNVARTAGRSLGVLTLLLDAGKGALAVAATSVVLGVSMDSGWPTLAGVAAFVGHVLPPWLRFRGGKGVATAFGVILVLSPWLAAAAAGTFAGLVLATRTVSIASIGAALVVTAIAFGLHGWEWRVTRVVTAILAVVLVRHRTNIVRLLRGEESRIGSRRSGSRSSRPPGG